MKEQFFTIETVELTNAKYLTINFTPETLTLLCDAFLQHKSDFGDSKSLHEIEQHIYLDPKTGKYHFYDKVYPFKSTIPEDYKLVGRWQVSERPEYLDLPPRYQFNAWLLDPEDGYATTLTRLSLALNLDGTVMSATFDHKVNGRERNFMVRKPEQDPERHLYEYGNSMSDSGSEEISSAIENLIIGFTTLLTGE
jgi:hypothetical protein